MDTQSTVCARESLPDCQDQQFTGTAPNAAEWRALYAARKPCTTARPVHLWRVGTCRQLVQTPASVES